MTARLGDYQEALQHPAQSFADPALRRARPEVDALGLPRARTGNMAIVFHLVGDRAEWAVRCFRRLRPDQGERYGAIARHLRSLALPYFADFEFQERGVLVAGLWQPIVKMAWVRGERLDRYVERRLGDPLGLLALADSWRDMLAALERGRVAHGDLQHGNVLVHDGQLRLVDYDGMFVPALGGSPALELGHPSYQHPLRTAADFGPHLDRFAGWVVLVALHALARCPELWHELHGGDDALLLRRPDFLDPLSRTWRRLEALGDRRLTAWADLLADAAAGPLPAVPPVGQETAPLVGPDGGPPPPRPLPAWLSATLQAERPSPREGSPAAGAPTATAPPGPLARGVALTTATALALALGLLCGRHPLPAAGTAGLAGALMAALRLLYARSAPALRRARLAAALKSVRREERGLSEDLADALRRRDRARAEGEQRSLSLTAERSALQGREREALLRLRQGLGLEDARRALREAVDRLREERARRLRDLRQAALREALQRHLVLHDPLLDIRLAQKRALAQAGVLSAYDILAVREQVVVTRDGQCHYLPGIGRERAERLRAWRDAAERSAQADLPRALPAGLERRLEEGGRASLAALRARQRRLLRRYLGMARALRADLARRDQELAEASRVLAAQEAERERAFAREIRAARGALRAARHRGADLGRELESLRGATFRAYLAALRPWRAGPP